MSSESPYARGVLLSDNNGQTNHAQERGLTSGDLGKFVSEGRFTEITAEKFSGLPSSLLLVAQREALLNSLRTMRRQQQDFVHADILDEMARVVNRFDSHVSTPQDQRPSIDVRNWEPADNSPAALMTAVDQGRFGDVTLSRFPQFSDHPHQLAAYKIDAINRALELAQAVRIGMQTPSYDDKNDELNAAISTYSESLKEMKYAIVEGIFVNNDHSVLY